MSLKKIIEEEKEKQLRQAEKKLKEELRQAQSKEQQEKVIEKERLEDWGKEAIMFLNIDGKFSSEQSFAKCLVEHNFCYKSSNIALERGEDSETLKTYLSEIEDRFGVKISLNHVYEREFSHRKYGVNCYKSYYNHTEVNFKLID